MPKTKDLPIEERTALFYSDLDFELQKLKDQNADSAYIQVFEDFVKKVKRTELFEAIRRKVRGRYLDPEIEEGEAAIERYEQQATALSDAKAELLSKIAAVQTGGNKALKKENLYIASLLANNEDILEQTQKAFNTAAEIVKSNTKTDDKVLQEYFDDFPEDGTRPSVEECCRISVKNTDSKEIFKYLYWIAHQDRTFTLGNSETDIYTKTYERLVNEINAATIDKKMEFVQIFCRHHKANLFMKEDDRTFSKLVTSFSGGDLGSIINRFAPDMKPKTVERNNYKSNLSPRNAALASLGAEYEKMLSDKRSASDSFTVMKNSVLDFIKEEEKYAEEDLPLAEENIAAYESKLNRAADAINIYINTHKGKRGTDKGKERKLIAENLKRTIEERKAALKQRVSDLERSAKISGLLPDAHRLNDVDPDLADQLIELGKVQRHIAPVRTIPKIPEYKAEPSKFQQIKGALGHYIFSAVNMLVGNTIGRLISNIARPFTQRNKATPEYNLDTNAIPGSIKEHFADVPVDNEPDNQPILSDTRRVPLIFERPLPEDPNQDPTISFAFSQGNEGDPTSYAENGTGHGQIILNYSKINPLTGKLQRYGLSIGFFPKGGFGSKNIELSQYLNGLKIPAVIGDDWDKAYATKKTFKANNKQINKIILASQNYDKDGYNSITRNCSTFVADMAKLVGIDVSSIMQEVDFTTDRSKDSLKLKLLGAPGMALLGPQFTRLAKRDILKKVGKKDLGYKNFGQDMLNAQDVERLWTLDFNTRMKGYSPSHTAESIRKEKGARLSSRQYQGSYTLHRGEYSDDAFARLATIYSTICDLKTTIDYELRGNKKETADTEPGKNTEKYCNTMLFAIAAQYNKLGSIAKLDFDNRTDQYKKLNTTIEQFKDGINHIYHETFKDNPELNIPFSHLVSTVEFLQHDVNNSYASYVSQFEPSDPQRDNNRLIDSASRAAEKYVITSGSGGNNELKLTPLQIAGFVKTFGTLSSGLLTLGKQRYGEEISDDDVRKLNTAYMFAEAEKSFFSGRPLSVEDVKFAFVDIPDAIHDKSVLRDRTTNYTTEQVYQSQVFTQMFGGMKKEFRDFISDYTKAKQGDKEAIAGNFMKTLDDKISKALENPKANKMLNKMKRALVPQIVSTIKKNGSNDAGYYNRVNNAFYKQFKDALVNSYLLPIADTAAKELRSENAIVLGPDDIQNVAKKIKDDPLTKIASAVKDQPNNALVDELEGEVPAVNKMQ